MTSKRDNGIPPIQPTGGTLTRSAAANKRKPQVRHQRTTQTIADTAEDLFIRHGYGSTTIDQIAKQANITKGGIYFCFKDKESLLLSLLERADELVLEPMLTRLSSYQDDPLGALDEYIYWWAKVAVGDWRKLLLPILMSLEFLHTETPTARHLERRYEKLYTAVGEILESGQNKRLLSTAGTPREFAMILIAITDGMLLEWLRHGPQIDGRALVKALRATLLSGMINVHGASTQIEAPET